MSNTLFIGLLAFFGALYIWIGSLASKKQKTNEEYFLMGRGLTLIPLFLTFLATQLGGGTLLGAADEAYQRGWSVVFYPLGASFGLVFLGLFVGTRYKKLGMTTTAELFEKIYRSKNQRRLSSLLSVISLLIILIAMAIAAKKFFLGIGIQNQAVFAALWLVLVGYTVMGGLRAVVNTDILQVLFIVGTLALALFMIKVPASNLMQSIDLPAEGSVPFVNWLLMPLLFMLIEQDMGQRCFAATKPKVVRMASLIAAVALMLSSSVGIYFGVLAKRAGIFVDPSSSVLVESVKAFTPTIVSTMFMVAIFMAIISTADSLLCSISSNISFDFLAELKIHEKSRVIFSKAITALIGVLALVASFFFKSVVTTLMFSYELSVSMLLVPTLGALFLKKPSKMSSSISLGTGAACFFLFKYGFAPPIPREVLTLTFAGFSFLATEAIIRRKQKIFS